MRVGFHPHKDKFQEDSEYIHQIIIPVYIPNQEGYFKDSFTIFKICIESLLSTIHDKTFVSIVNNGSAAFIKDYLDILYNDGKIHELIHTENIGKLNAILKGLAGNSIKLVTISDSDVLFLPNWQSATYTIYNNFPKAGVVGIVPQFRMYGYYCSNIIFDTFFSNRLKFTKVKDVIGLEKFYQSIGWKDDYNKDYLKMNLTIENNSLEAIVGSGHFVATYKKELFDEIITHNGYKMGADSESYLDKAPLKKGLWRLTTNKSYAFHLGNVYENWMIEEFSNNKLESIKVNYLAPQDKAKKVIFLVYYIKNQLFAKLFSKRKFKRFYYKIKGLPIQMVQNY